MSTPLPAAESSPCSKSVAVPAIAAPLSSTHLLRLFQLASPALPVGGYSYSQGLEAAVNAGHVKDAASARIWLEHFLVRFITRLEAPLMLISAQAFEDRDRAMLIDCCELYRSSRETAAGRDETRQMAWSLRKLAIEMNWLEGEGRALLESLDQPVFPVVFAIAGRALDIDPEQMLLAYLFSWLENQVIALQKLAPIGQSLGQRLLFELGGLIPGVLASAAARAELGVEALESMAPHLGILMARHESQYSRIFRT